MNIPISKCFLLPLLILMVQWKNRVALEVVSKYGVVLEEVPYGETVVLKCRSNDGYHNFDYWLINNGLNIVGPSNNDYDEAKYGYEVLSGNLTVKHVSEEEEGVYSCVSRAVRGNNVKIEKVKMLVISQNWEEAYEHDKHINAIRILIVLITLVLLGIGGYVIWMIWKDRFKYPGYLEQADGGESREVVYGFTDISRSRSPGRIVVDEDNRDNTEKFDNSTDFESFLDTSNKDQAEWCLNIFFYIGVHPQKRDILTQNCIFLCNMVLLVVFTYLISDSAIHDDGPPLEVITGALESLYLLVHAMVKLSALGLKHREMNSIIEATTIFWKVEDEPDAGKEAENQKVLDHLEKIFYFYIISAAIPAIFISLRPFIMTERVLIFNSYIPTDDLVYYSAFVFELYALWVIFFACVLFDVFLATSIVLAKVQFSLLNQEIKRTMEFRVESEGDRYDQQVKIKKCVDYHNFLLRYVDKINNSFSNVVLVYFGIFLFSECVQMFLVSNKPSSKEAFKCAMYMASITNQFVVFYCLPSHLLTCEAEKTRDIAFLSGCHEIPSKRTKCFINMLALEGNKEVFICAGKFVQLGMRSCLLTFQKIFSYYMFLRTIQGK